ncbi:MAG TPA: hypothetical protein VMY05_06530 [Acidobacteriota bacterium]|nr:hypothetical protein [Acidobacteriota bacterium]
MKSCVFVLLLITAAIPCTAQVPNGEDILGKILNEVGFDRSDLGFEPKGFWSRFPLDIPYRLTSFDDLFAEPLRLYDYAATMGNAVELYLAPGYADTAENGLYKLTYHLGVDRKLGGFRSYSANLAPAPPGDEPLVAAFERLYVMAGQPTDIYTFGAKADVSTIGDKVRAGTEMLPDTVKTVLAELITNLAEAVKWRNLAFRNCDGQDMQSAVSIRDLASTQGDGQVYYSELDDIARALDWPSLHYAALKAVAAAERAERKLIPLARQVPDDFACEIPTPYGKVAMFSPVYLRDKLPHGFFSSLRAPLPDWMAYDASNTLCVIDFGRNSIWYGSAGATASIANPVSVLIDLGGDDYYGYENTPLPPTTGVGLCGVGVVIDSKGKDHYFGSTYAQGAGLFGVGVLLDRSGNDRYRANESAQGCGYFGIGLCLDGTGDDDFYLYGDGQGMGGIGGGVGVLASFDGNDKYTAEPYAEVFNRGDYHSEQVINANVAQGAGFGRRGDGSDGHAWAGGLGAIIDIQGDDEYYSGNWTLGIGYWFGTGIALDRSGDDHYKSCYFTQGSGAHYCNGILIDEGGNDNHDLFETAGAALAFGWDYTNALLINKGGNDTYRAKMISFGLAEIRSNALCIDIGGDDQYYFAEGARGMGAATWRADFERPGKVLTYNTYVKSFGGFIDVGGNDGYFSFKDGQNSPHPTAANNSLWFQPARTDSTFGANNYGVGIDVEDGTIPELDKWD